ncbi:MAG: hypothetical protein JWO96_646 [Candidatus Saccharibacteria bacterium]|nr:hypothetical protein [Candidatus Saccharibacteria bacterium]
MLDDLKLELLDPKEETANNVLKRPDLVIIPEIKINEEATVLESKRTAVISAEAEDPTLSAEEAIFDTPHQELNLADVETDPNPESILETGLHREAEEIERLGDELSDVSIEEDYLPLTGDTEPAEAEDIVPNDAGLVEEMQPTDLYIPVPLEPEVIRKQLTEAFRQIEPEVVEQANELVHEIVEIARQIQEIDPAEEQELASTEQELEELCVSLFECLKADYDEAVIEKFVRNIIEKAEHEERVVEELLTKDGTHEHQLNDSALLGKLSALINYKSRPFSAIGRYAIKHNPFFVQLPEMAISF